MPPVSVIMPAFNVEHYIAEAIESVLAQTFTDCRLVIVDDGSTDRTLAIAERYRDAFPDRIVLLSQDNRGVAAARNRAIAACRAEVFALLDADDAWWPTFLEAQMRILDAQPRLAIVSGNALVRGGPNHGQPVRPPVDPRPGPGLLEILADEQAVFIMAVFRRSVLDEIGGFDERFRSNEDYDFWIRAAAAGFAFARNSTPLAYYSRHSASLSASEVRMVGGVIRVYRKTLETCPLGTTGRSIVERQIERFEAELLRAQTRAALAEGDAVSAAASIEALRLRTGGIRLAVAASALRWLPRFALRVYATRRRVRSVRTGLPAPLSADQAL